LLFGNEGLHEVTVEVFAAVFRKPVDHPAGSEQGILLLREDERADCGPDSLRLCPTSFPGPRIQELQLVFFHIHLQRLDHDPICYWIMIPESSLS
jgi:hypothetical protein